MKHYKILQYQDVLGYYLITGTDSHTNELQYCVCAVEYDIRKLYVNRAMHAHLLYVCETIETAHFEICKLMDKWEKITKRQHPQCFHSEHPDLSKNDYTLITPYLPRWYDDELNRRKI